VKREDWIWMPHPAHFIGGTDCRFFLATYVGEYIVSTVGQYRPGPPLHERGEDVEIGLDRLFETMVFRAKPTPDAECGCTFQIDVAEEVDFAPYNDPKSAAVGHYAMCEKWAEGVES